MRTLIIFVIFCCSVGCSPKPPSNQEISDWFEGNYDSLNELKVIGQTHPSLQRVEPALKKYTHYNGTPTDEAKLAEKRVYEILKELDVELVIFSRTIPESTDISFVTIPVYRRGLVTGGFSVSITYVEEKESIEKILKNGYKDSFTELSKSKWYINESDDR